MNDLIIIDAASQEVVTRAYEVQKRITEIKSAIESSFVDLCLLLLEARENAYHNVWGYAQFGDWVEQGSGLDISARQAYYYIGIAEGARKMGIEVDTLKAIKISKLKEIFSLSVDSHEVEIKKLLSAAEDESLAEVKEKVAKLKQQTGEPEYVHMTLKLEKAVKEVVDEAIELARKNYGDTINEHGDVADISVSKAMELICAEYLNDPNNFGDD